MFIDAPVLNYCSFPGKIGNEDCERVWEKEFIKVYPGIKRYRLVNFEEHPINMADTLIRNKIPVIMVYGSTDLLKTIRVGCRGHHPHGMIDLEDNNAIADWINEHS